jgi:hypothetical protein
MAPCVESRASSPSLSRRPGEREKAIASRASVGLEGRTDMRPAPPMSETESRAIPCSPVIRLSSAESAPTASATPAMESPERSGWARISRKAVKAPNPNDDRIRLMRASPPPDRGGWP